VAQVLEKENLQKAWEQVKANKGAPGIDNMSVEEFPEYVLMHRRESNALFWKGPTIPHR